MGRPRSLTDELDVLLPSLERALTRATDDLHSERTSRGIWDGELSTSALSTATAVMALHLLHREGIESCDGRPLSELIDGGVHWLAEHQNGDGGWGDTVKSFSNISTTMLAAAVFHAVGADANYPESTARADLWVEDAGGVEAVRRRYGKDKTFSVPILTHCALAGLVEWSQVPALPFELAWLPHRFYAALRLPVVSYALPALIAMGQVRHHHLPSKNPLIKRIRHRAIEPTLAALERIQPTNGGFLEATPLTSFVTMSLAGKGLANHPVAQRGLHFIVSSVRADGSWPIDTNLSTWVTTLAINALGDEVPEDTRSAAIEWLMSQQYRHVHPYTNAAPGGWSWTDLPGGVPDADDTPGAILAMLTLIGEREATDEEAASILSALGWLLDLQNRDGGWPTFCRGWGALPFDRSSPDITAHVLRAIRAIDRKGLSATPTGRSDNAIRRGFAFLARRQRPDGSWLPLWFGNQHTIEENNPTYGTARVLAAWFGAGRGGEQPATRGVDWLLQNQNEDGGWGAGPGTPSSVEESALAVEMLAAAGITNRQLVRGVCWLVDRIGSGGHLEPTPIGFYFAKLWYFERLYPRIFAVSALRTAVARLSPVVTSATIEEPVPDRGSGCA